MALKFIKCANCETIIEIKDLDVPFTADILNQADETNTIRGVDLCAACGAEQATPNPSEDEDSEEEQEESPEEEETEENSAEETPAEEN